MAQRPNVTAVLLYLVAWQLLAASAGVPSGGVVIEPHFHAEHKELKDEHQDRTDRTVDVYYPSPMPEVANRNFPLISFAHGYSGGGPVDNIAYGELLRSLAGFGYVVVSPRACDYGCECKTHCSLPGDPDGFQVFYRMQLRAIEWARGMAGRPGPFAELDLSPGAGVAGHSMGGQATVFSSSLNNATDFGIRAAVMHHAYTHVFPPSQVPFLAFTGTKDTTAPPAMAESIYNAPGASRIRGLVNRVGATHHEPDVTGYNPLLPQFTAAWFKLYLEGKREEYGVDFEDLLYGNGTHTLCGGGGGAMENCTLLR
jgi:hypothetical protein